MDDLTHTFELEAPAPKAPAPRDLISKITIAVMGSVAVVLALIAVDVVLITGAQQPPPRPVVQVVKLAGTQTVQRVVNLSVSPEVKPGADGKLHDAFSVTDFTVHAGVPVRLVINNTDSAPHSIDSPAAGVRIIARPGMHAYTLLVHSTGRFEWYCMLPCDPYSMTHVGYMRGYITSV